MSRVEYMAAVKVGLGGDEWTASTTYIGKLAGDYASHCYMTDVPVEECVATIKIKLPEEEM